MMQHTLPEPCSEEYLAEVEAWTKLPETRTKEEVMEEELGEKPVTKPVAEEASLVANFTLGTDHSCRVLKPCMLLHATVLCL